MGAMPGGEAVPNGRKGRWMEGAVMRGCRRGCQSGISDGQKDGRNRGGFLYSDRGSTTEKGCSKVPAGEVERGERM